MIQDAKVKIVHARRRISRTIRKLKRARRQVGDTSGGIRPENVVWIFGAARTGSTWLGAMMADLGGHAWWHEPMVGHLFGHLYQERAGRRDDEHFILGGEKDLWLGPVRRFVLDSANTRFPEVAERNGYLVVKEPHGAQGAALLAEALPESRLVFLIRDPRDVVASRMDLAAKGSVTRDAMKKRGQEKKNTSADERPDVFVKSQARRYLQHIRLVKEAYDAHGGPKVLVRYEDLTSRHAERDEAPLLLTLDPRRRAGARKGRGETPLGEGTRKEEGHGQVLPEGHARGMDGGLDPGADKNGGEDRRPPPRGILRRAPAPRPRVTAQTAKRSDVTPSGVLTDYRAASSSSRRRLR